MVEGATDKEDKDAFPWAGKGNEADSSLEPLEGVKCGPANTQNLTQWKWFQTSNLRIVRQ